MWAPAFPGTNDATLVARVIARRVPWIAIPLRSIVAIAPRRIVRDWPGIDAGRLVRVGIATAVGVVEVISVRTAAVWTAAKLDLLERGRLGSGYANLEGEGRTGDSCKHVYVLRVTPRSIIWLLRVMVAELGIHQPFTFGCGSLRTVRRLHTMVSARR
jgi:hypothetical protein